MIWVERGRLTLCLLAVVVAESLFKAGDYFKLWTFFPNTPYFGRDLFLNYSNYLAWKDGFYKVYSPELYGAWARARHLSELPSMYPPLVFPLHSTLDGISSWEEYRHIYFLLNHVWIGLTLVVLAWTFWPQWRRSLVPLLALALPALLWSGPLIDSLFAGQINPLLGLTMVSFAGLWLRGRKLLACLPLALGISIKIAPILFVTMLIRKREGKMLAALGMWMGLLTLPVWFQTGSLAPYLDYVRDSLRILGIQPGYQNFSLPAVTRLLLTPSPEWGWIADAPGWAPMLGTALALGVLAISLRAVSPGPTPAPVLGRELALFFMLILIVPTQSWNYYGFYALEGYLIFWLAAGPQRELSPALLLSTVLIGALCLLNGIIGGTRLRVFMMITFMQYHLGLWIYLGLWYWMWRACRDGSRQAGNGSGAGA